METTQEHSPLQDQTKVENTFGQHPLQAQSSGNSHNPPPFQLQAKPEAPLQLSVDTHFGTFEDVKYEAQEFGATGRGAEMEMTFDPAENVDATKIGITQSIKNMWNGDTFFLNSDDWYENRALSEDEAMDRDEHTLGGTDEGTMIDRFKPKNNPIYGSDNLADGQTLEDTPQDNNTTADDVDLGVNATYHLGHRYMDGDDLKKKKAGLWDFPKIRSKDVSRNSGQIFETTAVALSGNQKDSYYGSVQWGWQTDGEGNFSKVPFEKVSEGVPSSSFLAAAEKWNGGQSESGAENGDLPLVDVKINAAPVNQFLPDGFNGPPLQLPEGTRVTIVTENNDAGNGVVRVVDGPYTGNTIELSATDMAQFGNERE